MERSPSSLRKSVFMVLFRLALATLIVFLLAPSRLPSVGLPGARAEAVYEYYGYTPPSNYSMLDSDFPDLIAKKDWEVDPVTGSYKRNYGYLDNGTCYLDIVGINDSTRVWVYLITGGEPALRESFTVNRMELHNTTIPSKTYFKVVSDKRVAVLPGGGGSSGIAGAGTGTTIHVFYPSTDGGFAGKEFIFMAFSQVTGNGPGAFVTVHAIDDAKVEIYDDAGRLVKGLELKANSTVDNLTLVGRRLYRAVSTGRIMIATWGVFSFTVVPSVMGGYVGNHFFVYPNQEKNQEVASLVVVNQNRSNRVQLIDTVKGAVVVEKTMAPSSYWFIHYKEAEGILRAKLIVQGTADLILFAGGTTHISPGITIMSQGIAFLGVKADQPTTLYTFSKAIAFSPEANAHITVGTLELEVGKGDYTELPAGLITLRSNATLIVQVISQDPYTFGVYVPFEVPALVSWGAYMITTETVRIVYPPPRTAGDEANLLLYGGIAAVAVAAVTALLIVLRRPWKRS